MGAGDLPKAGLEPPHFPSSLHYLPPEAAARGVSQAQAEGLNVVDVDQLEKVLPQLVRGMQVGQSAAPQNGACVLTLSPFLLHSSWTSRVPLLWACRV